MDEKNNIYLSALLHNIGRFIEQDEHKNSDEDTKRFFIKEVFKDYISKDQDGVLQKIIRIADDLASAERSEDEAIEPDKYYKANLEVPFNDIQIIIKEKTAKKELKLNKKYYYSKSILRIDNQDQFPIPDSETEGKKIIDHLNNFLDEFKNVGDSESLLALMEKYLIHIPAQSLIADGKEHLYKSEINLYDHSRVVAAITLVLYEEFIHGSFKGKEERFFSNSYKTELSNPAILICGNVNGIQDFIFNVKSKKAAKNLKGRSYFIQILTDIASKMIIDKFELGTANILYNGGGNFFILAPNYRKEQIAEIQQVLSKNIINTGLYISLGYTEVKFNDFKNFGNAFDSSVRASNDAKKKKYYKTDYKEIFDPFPQKIRGEEDYYELTESLQKSQSYCYGIFDGKTKRNKWEKVFNNLGFQIDFNNSNKLHKQAVIFNDVNFSKEYQSFRFAVKDLPKWNKDLTNKFKKELGNEFEYEEGENINTILQYKRFAQLAKFDTGTDKIGVLKMDVDNLGMIFKDGLLHAKPTIGRITFLSRSIKWFFEGYMNSLLTQPDYNDRIYVIFSGGDDFFLVGAWNAVFNFAIGVREEFRKFVANHPGINLSAALLVVDETFPIQQIANLAEERLEKAKQRVEFKTKIKIKDALSVFDTVLSWEDFSQAKELKDKIVEIINLTSGNRAIINKIQKSSSGFAGIQADALLGGIIKMYKVWRLSYYLRDLVNISKKNPNADKIKTKVNEIVRLYEELYFKAFRGDETSIQLFPVAARWAELETRNIKENKL